MFHTEEINYDPVTVYLLYYNEHFSVEKHLDCVLPEERQKLQSIKHPIKKAEFVAVRILRTKYFEKNPIFYSEIGAPYFENEGYISISHARCVVGLAYCKQFSVGLDLEPIDEKVMRVKNKFLSEDEKKAADTSSVEEMIKIWSGKEALYKLAGRKKIIFAENLLLTKIDAFNWKGIICFQKNKMETELNISKKHNFVISINTSPLYEIK